MRIQNIRPKLSDLSIDNEEIKELIDSCWNSDPKLRWNATKLTRVLDLMHHDCR